MSSTPEPISHLSHFSSCEISDALIKLGVKLGGHIPDMEMYSPYSIHSSEAEGVKICGPAFTVKMVEASDQSSPSPKHHFVDAAPEGHVIVITSPSRMSTLLIKDMCTLT